jgi:hypothetical protein
VPSEVSNVAYIPGWRVIVSFHNVSLADGRSTMRILCGDGRLGRPIKGAAERRGCAV